MLPGRPAIDDNADDAAAFASALRFIKNLRVSCTLPWRQEENNANVIGDDHDLRVSCARISTNFDPLAH